MASIIIPTRNSERTIDKCLESIENQTYRNIEVIIVDQSSTDRTLDIAKKYSTKILSLPAPRFYTPPSKSRNRGAAKANGRYLFHVDSDMGLPRKAVEKCVEKCKNGAGAVVVHEVDEGLGFWSTCKALERSCYIDDPLIEAARFFTRKAFDRVGGYDESLSSGEDWDIHRRVKKAGFEIGYICEPIVHYIGKIRLVEQIKKKYYYGSTIYEYIRKNPAMARRQVTLVRPAFVRNRRRLARDPVHAVGMLVMKACEFGAAGLGYLKSRISK